MSAKTGTPAEVGKASAAAELIAREREGVPQPPPPPSSKTVPTQPSSTTVPPPSASKPADSVAASPGTGITAPADTGSQAGGSGAQPSESPLAPNAGGEAKGEGLGGSGAGDEDKSGTPRRTSHRCAFSFAHRVCALPAVSGAVAVAQSSYDAVKRSSRFTEIVFSVAETGLQLAAGPVTLCAVPVCFVMAVPVCVADFGLNRALDVFEYVVPCVTYDCEQAKKTAARIGVRIITLPESAADAVIKILNTCPAKAIVKAVQLTSDIAGKTFEVFIYCPKEGENSICDAAFRFASLPCHIARRMIAAVEKTRVTMRDRLSELS